MQQLLCSDDAGVHYNFGTLQPYPLHGGSSSSSASLSAALNPVQFGSAI